MPTFLVSPPVALHIVTGKGGTGKTTVAAALGLALAKGGARVLVVEVEGRRVLPLEPVEEDLFVARVPLFRGLTHA